MIQNPNPGIGVSRIPILREKFVDMDVFVTCSTTNSIDTSLFEAVHGGYSYMCDSNFSLFFLLVYDDQDFRTLGWIP